MAPAATAMTSQGTAHGRFTRAVRDRHLQRAEMAAREIGELSLPDALAFCLLLADFEPERWPRAAARWHARFVQEAVGIGIDEARLALAAVRGLPGPHEELATQTLQRLAASYGLNDVVQSPTVSAAVPERLVRRFQARCQIQSG